MTNRRINLAVLEDFRAYLIDREKSPSTIEKYIRDVLHFARYAAGQLINKQLLIAYKMLLAKDYAATSANSMLASLNAFMHFQGWSDLCVRQFKVQRQPFIAEDKELSKAEYERLVHAAQRRGNERLQLILQTICGTGIRVSELQHVTVEAVAQGEAMVRCKGKTRYIFIVPELCRLLLRYAAEHGIMTGPVFITRRGKPVSRTAIWRDMKALCQQANVAPGKVFPHNLRHLFARTFYSMDKDIAKLADVLGHTSINTTRIYIATTGAEHRRRMEHMHLIINQKTDVPGRRPLCT